MRASDRGLHFAVLWGCTALATLSYVGILASFGRSAWFPEVDLADLVLRSAASWEGAQEGAELIFRPAPLYVELPETWLIGLWVTSVVAAFVAWTAILRAPVCRGPRHLA